MSYWEVLIGTISGFIIAFFAEPIKTYFNTRSKKTQLRMSLYREMLHMYSGFEGLIQKIDENKIKIEQVPANLENLSRFECYNYAKSNNAIILFYQLKEATHIDIVYKNFRLIYSDYLKTIEERINFTRAAIEVFKQKVSKREIDETLLQKVGWH